MPNMSLHAYTIIPERESEVYTFSGFYIPEPERLSAWLGIFLYAYNTYDVQNYGKKENALSLKKLNIITSPHTPQLTPQLPTTTPSHCP